MKLEKRSSGAEQAPAADSQETTPKGKKPVVVYIMILFIVAFLLMALSFMMHQRSNSEVLGELQNSVSAMQEIQDTQDQILDLQKQLSDAEEDQAELESQLEEAQKSAEDAQLKADALLALYTLQQQYSAGDYDACRRTLQNMTEQGLQDYLPTDNVNDVTSPAQRFEQLNEAVLNH